MRITIAKVLCPVDFSVASDRAVRYALAFAQAHGAQLRLLHVVESRPLPLTDFPAAPEVPLEADAELAEDVRRQLLDMVAGLQKEHAEVSGELICGVPEEEITRLARDEGVDLVVMGTHGHSGLLHMLLGSVAEKVVRRAPCPVLVVKDPEHEFVSPE